MNRTTAEVITGTAPVGGQAPLRPNRRFEILAKDLVSVEQAAPVRLVYGQARVSITQIYPVFGFRSEAVTTEAGK